MKLYRIEFDTPENGPMEMWAGTQADAKKLQKELEEQWGRHNVENFRATEVPTDKPGLISWLNNRAAV